MEKKPNLPETENTTSKVSDTKHQLIKMQAMRKAIFENNQRIKIQQKKEDNSTINQNQTDKDYLIRMKAMRMAITKKAAENKLKKK